MKHNQLIIETDIPAKMRDGVTLYADIYRPAGEGKYPVLLTRLPYSKSYGLHFIRPNILAEQGYIVIVQDVRGRYTSEGEFVPYIAEVDDGYDTIEWAANLPYSNGDVGMFGLSYYGYTQILAAISGNKHLKVIAPIMAQNSMTDVFNDHDGALELGMWETWNLESMLPNMLARTYKTRDELEAATKALMKNLDHLDVLYQFKPYKDWPAIGQNEMPYFSELLNYEPEHNHWQKIDAKSNYNKINVPGLHVAGWYDCFLDKTIANFQNGHLRGLGDKLIIGPWTHANFTQMIGDRDFGMAATKWGEANMHARHIEWFNHWLKKEPLPASAPVNYFVMGLNDWKTAENWPPQNANMTPLYFKKEKVSAEFTPPTTSSEAKFNYNPEKPVPSNGGGTLHKALHADGPRDQQTIELREDVLCYSTDPLEEAIEVTGSIQVKLWAKTNAPNTDFTAKLVDVFPDGTAFNLADGIIRANKQHSDNVQNNINEYTIDLWATSNLFQKGHRIRVEISSSNFPRFDPNPNTGSSFIHSTESQIASQTIYHSPEYPSHILLPIIR